MSKTSGPQSYLVLENYIGGRFVPCQGHIDSYDPSTGEVYCKVPDSGEKEVGLPLYLNIYNLLHHCLMFVLIKKSNLLSSFIK